MISIRRKRPLMLACLFAAVIFAALPSFAGETVETLTGGLVFKSIVRGEVPWAIQTLELDRNSRSLAIGVEIGCGRILGIEPLDRIIERFSKGGRKVDAAINGDFYILQADPFQGDPIGLCVADGELVSTPVKRSVLAFAADGTPSIGLFKFTGEVASQSGKHAIRGVNQSCSPNGIILLTPRFNDETRAEEGAVVVLAGPFEKKLSPAESFRVSVIEKRTGGPVVAIPPNRIALVGRGEGGKFLESLAAGDDITVTVAVEPGYGSIVNAVGGGPRLMRGGKISIEASREGIGKSFVDTRHPRTAFGWNDTTYFFVTVDGRQEGYSAGMSLTELAAFMKEIGATEAINLDGGGSTTMWADGKVRNRPSDKHLRPLSNGIVVYETGR